MDWTEQLPSYALNFHVCIWIQHGNGMINMNTNKPGIGAVFLEIAMWFWKFFIYFFVVHWNAACGENIKKCHYAIDNVFLVQLLSQDIFKNPSLVYKAFSKSVSQTMLLQLYFVCGKFNWFSHINKASLCFKIKPIWNWLKHPNNVWWTTYFCTALSCNMFKNSSLHL